MAALAAPLVLDDLQKGDKSIIRSTAKKGRSQALMLVAVVCFCCCCCVAIIVAAIILLVVTRG